MLANPYALRERSVTGVTKRSSGDEDPNDRKGKLPKKTCGNGAPTTTYGAPTGDKEFHVLRVSQLHFNDRTKSFEFEVELELIADPENTHAYWLTWAEMNSFPQYQIALWFYLRDYVTTWAAADFEDFVPSSSAVRAVEAEEEEEAGSSSTSLRRAGSVCAKGHTKFVDDSDSD